MDCWCTVNYEITSFAGDKWVAFECLYYKDTLIGHHDNPEDKAQAIHISRVLNDGGIQRSDGRYCYQYMDAFGKRKSVYSWRLTPSDKTPTGKRKDLSLREKEKEINSEISSVVSCGNITVLELVEKYISQKTGVRHNTQANYNFVINIVKKEEFGIRRIDKVKLSDAKE